MKQVKVANQFKDSKIHSTMDVRESNQDFSEKSTFRKPKRSHVYLSPILAPEPVDAKIKRINQQERRMHHNMDKVHDL